MMLFQIENRYSYGLKVTELQVHQLKEIYFEDLDSFKLKKNPDSEIVCLAISFKIFFVQI